MKSLSEQWKSLAPMLKSTRFTLLTNDALPFNTTILRFIKQLYVAYCKQSVEQHRAGNWNKVIQEQVRNDALQPRMESIHELLKTIKTALEEHHEKTEHASWISLGYNQKESEAQLDHFKKLYNFMVRSDFRDLATCRDLLQQIREGVSNTNFQPSFWRGNFYHDYLVQLQKEVYLLGKQILSFKPMTSHAKVMGCIYQQDEKKHSVEPVEQVEFKRQKRVSVAESGCSLYAKEQDHQSLPLSPDSYESKGYRA
jgi:hypothetical protein